MPECQHFHFKGSNDAMSTFIQCLAIVLLLLLAKEKAVLVVVEGTVF